MSLWAQVSHQNVLVLELLSIIHIYTKHIVQLMNINDPLTMNRIFQSLGYEEQSEKESSRWINLSILAQILEHLCKSSGKRMKFGGGGGYGQVVHQTLLESQ